MKNLYLLLVALTTITLNSCSADEPSKSPEKNILSFSFKSITPNVDGVIDYNSKTINLEFPYGMDIDSLVPNIELPHFAKISPSAMTAQNFSVPVQYTVTADDGTTQIFTTQTKYKILVTGIDRDTISLSNNDHMIISGFFIPTGNQIELIDGNNTTFLLNKENESKDKIEVSFPNTLPEGKYKGLNVKSGSYSTSLYKEINIIN